MNRVELLAPRQLGLFGESSGPLAVLCAAEYDPEVTLFAEALESTGVPEAVRVTQQSYRCDGEGWVWRDNLGGAVCQGYVARIEVLS